MKCKTVFLSFVVMLLLVPLRVQGTQDVHDILTRTKQAAGGVSWDKISTLHVRMKITTGGMEGPAETFEGLKGGRHLTRFELGPVSGEDGFDGKTVWRKDSSGQVLKLDGKGEREGAVNEAYRACRAFWYPDRWPAEIEYVGREEEGGRTFHVLRITPGQGRPFDMWVDAGSWLIDRTVENTGSETRTGYFSDYRPVGGVLYPYSSRSSNGETRYDVYATVESLEFNEPFEDELFSMPPPPPPDFAFVEDRTRTVIPFQLVNNHIYIDIKLNGRGPFRVMCDTGGANVITPTLAGELGLEPTGTIQGRGAGEQSEDVSLVEVESLTVGGVTISDQVFFIFPLESFSEIEGVPQSGLVGYEVFKRFVVSIDYENGVLTLIKPDDFSYSENGTIVPFLFDGSTPQAEGTIDGISGMFTIDTGSRASLTLHGPFVEENDLMSHFSPELEGVTGWGVGGPVRTRVGRARELRLGDVEFTSPVTELSLQSAGAFTNTYVAGNVGAGLLKRYNIIFDYQGQKMYFEPNRNLGQRDVFDRSGMWINAVDSTFRVMDVIAGGPADSAGLEVGDMIVAVDGRDSAGMSLPDLRLRFRMEPPGTRIKFTVKREAEKYEKVLILKDLV